MKPPGTLRAILGWSCLLLAMARPPVKAQGTTPPPAEVELQSGQTLEDLAEQQFDDPEAANEIRALNQIPKAAQPKPGAVLRLPGKERELALTALRVALQALQLAKSEGAEQYAPKPLELAAKSLGAAQAARTRADYAECRRLADETWALARQARQESLARRPNKNRFTVSVDDQGTTRLAVVEGDGVKVTAGNRSTTVKRGQSAQVKAGQPPEKAHPLLPPPEPVLPNDGSVLVTSSIYFSWKPVAGASRYVLLISKDRNGLNPIRQLTTENTFYLFRSSLPDGRYFWFSRTVDLQGMVGQASPPRQLILQASSDGGLTVEQVAPDSPGKGI